MKKIAYIFAAVYAVFSLSVTSLAIEPILEGAEDAVDTVASDAEDILGMGEGDGTSADEPDAADPSDTQDDAAGSSDAGTDDPADATTTDGAAAEPDTTTTAPTNVGNTGDSGNPATGVALGFTALGLAAAGLTAAAARKRK